MDGGGAGPADLGRTLWREVRVHLLRAEAGQDPLAEADAIGALLKRLAHGERVTLAMGALAALPRRSAYEVAAWAVDATGPAGQPLPLWVGMETHAEAAADWARFATLHERKAYVAAIFKSLSDDDKRGFLSFAQKVIG